MNSDEGEVVYCDDDVVHIMIEGMKDVIELSHCDFAVSFYPAYCIKDSRLNIAKVSVTDHAHRLREKASTLPSFDVDISAEDTKEILTCTVIVTFSKC